MNPVIKLVFAILTGGLFGIIGLKLIPFETRFGIISVVLEPFFDAWVRLLNALAGPVIFFMVMTTMLNTQKITEKGGNRRLMFVRYFLLSFGIGFLAVSIAAMLLRLSIMRDRFGGGGLQDTGPAG